MQFLLESLPKNLGGQYCPSRPDREKIPSGHQENTKSWFRYSRYWMKVRGSVLETTQRNKSFQLEGLDWIVNMKLVNFALKLIYYYC